MAEHVGPLLIIGGHEDKEGDRIILETLAGLLRGGRLVIATIASKEPEGYFDSYKAAFAPLGQTDLVELYVEERSDSGTREALATLEGAAGVFFIILFRELAGQVCYQFLHLLFLPLIPTLVIVNFVFLAFQ